jgi:hypothetical protein
MKKAKLKVTLLALLLALVLPTSAQALPRGFFGVVPQADLTEADAAYMAAGGIESLRVPLMWGAVQSTASSAYDWTAMDRTVAIASHAGIRVLPFLVGTPSWLERKGTTLPVGDSLERTGWTAFVQAAVERYGHGGSFWTEHGPFSASPVPVRPIIAWQIWNEANFHYFAFPVSAGRYAKLLELSAPAIRAADPHAHILLSGLFGKPDRRGRFGVPAAQFLTELYEIPGLRNDFDGVALHPYAFDTASLVRMVEGVQRVLLANHDRPDLYLTEMGWGSQNDPKVVAFEQGPIGQARELKSAYRYLIGNQQRLGLAGVYWFSWKDLDGSCSFCDSSGLLDEGSGFQPKPAWGAFVHLAGGRPYP